MGARIVSILFGVVVITALIIQHQASTTPVKTVMSSFIEEESFDSYEESPEDSGFSRIETVEVEAAVPKPPGMISFSKAFAVARDALGPDKTFTWNGNQYSTNTVDEAALKEEKQSEIELTDVQDSLDNALTQALSSSL